MQGAWNPNIYVYCPLCSEFPGPRIYQAVNADATQTSASEAFFFLHHCLFWQGHGLWKSKLNQIKNTGGQSNSEKQIRVVKHCLNAENGIENCAPELDKWSGRR